MSALVLLAALAGWLAVNPYIGIDHDATHYVAAALRWLSSASYARDLLFLDAQDDWTLFSPLLSGVVLLLGVERGAIALTLLSGALYLGACHYMLAALLRGRGRQLAFLLCASAPLAYGYQDVFSVTEGFVSSRGLAVGLSLLALASTLRARARCSLLLHLGAMALHPIMAFPPLAISVLLLAGGYARWLFIVGIFFSSVILAGAVAGWLSVASGAWLASLQQDGVVFVGYWMDRDAASLAGILAVLLLAARYGQPGARAFYFWTALVVLGGLTLSYIASEWIHVVLLLQSQPWRAEWIGVIACAVAVADLFVRQVVRKRAQAPLVWLIALAAVVAARDHAGWGLLVMACVAWALSPVRLRVLNMRLLPYRAYVLAFVCTLLLLFIPSYLAQLALSARGFEAPNFMHSVVDGFFRTGGLGLFALCVWVSSKHFPRATAVSVAVYFCCAAAYWDLRSDERRGWESAYTVDASRSPFGRAIDRGAVVYWQLRTERVWLELGTAGYAGQRHVAGLVFSEKRFNAILPRMERLLASSLTAEQFRHPKDREGKPLGFAEATDGRQIEFVRHRLLSSYERMAPLTEFGLALLCDDPEIDFVIDTLHVPQYSDRMYVESIGRRKNTWYLYRCERLRAHLDARDGGDGALAA